MTALVRVPLARLTRSPRAWVGIVGWTLLALLGAIVVRMRSEPSGADHVMRGSFGTIVVPLVAFAVVGAVVGGGGMRRGIRGVVALGAEPREAALATVGVAVAVMAVIGGVAAFVVCALAHGSADPPLLRDLPMSFGVGALGGAAYAAYFSAGSAIGRGAMRGVFLALDWVIGSGAGFGSLFTPRAHVRSLLGGAPTFELSSRASSVFLFAILLLWIVLAVAFGRKPAR
jgi:hypothetical protein